jgi:hypothetical protein
LLYGKAILRRIACCDFPCPQVAIVGSILDAAFYQLSVRKASDAVLGTYLGTKNAGAHTKPHIA